MFQLASLPLKDAKLLNKYGESALDSAIAGGHGLLAERHVPNKILTLCCIRHILSSLIPSLSLSSLYLSSTIVELATHSHSVFFISILHISCFFFSSSLEIKSYFAEG